MKQHAWYRFSDTQALNEQKSSLSTGLLDREVAQRAHDHGPNRLQEAQRKSPLKILLAQFSDFLVLVLIAAAIISSFLGEPADTFAIIAIVLLNAALGFYQEYRAERAMEALKAMSAPLARVKRNGQIRTIPSFGLVPGDIVLLEAGNIVPADLRVLESFQLGVDESALTGESVPVSKDSASIEMEQLAVPDQKNMVFKGTIVTAGRGVGLVVRTGMSTELGRIATLLKDEVEVRTPLQNRMTRFAKKLSIIVVALCVVVFLGGVLRGEEPVLMFMTALSLAVAAIPEALPAVITVSLALGARAMIRRNALVRKLPAVEALGSVTYICSDKTGTLTQNKMQAKGFYVNDSFAEEIPKDWSEDSACALLVKTLLLNNDVSVGPKGELQGDPTETALVQAALDLGLEKSSFESRLPRIAELPFSSERGMMTTVHKDREGSIVLTKGAPERVLPLCTKALGLKGPQPIQNDSLLQEAQNMAAKGFRVLAVASRVFEGDLTDGNLESQEMDLTFIGLVGLIDPPREEAKRAIELCKAAGIHPVMITGDHPMTAKAIATQLGIIKESSVEIVTGDQLLSYTDTHLQENVRKIGVYARVAPEQKIRIVKALQTAGEIVAMTGDGVNDAPALRRADVGVSMGKGGTDVAREASHVILLDDNFATIVAAVREGRRIYDNIRKFIRFALSGNSGEIWTLFLAPFVGLPVPLLPIHILWVNLVTDGLPGIALAMEPEERDIMKRRPRPPGENIFARGLWQHALWVGLLTAAATLGTLAWAYHTGHAHWQSMAFTVLTFVQMGHALAIRSERDSFFTLGLRSNLPLFGAVVLTMILQLATLYVPFLNPIFKTEPLSFSELGVCIIVSTSVFAAVEVEKWYRRRRGDF